ncbi:MAG TPA: T9SS type A sorting domain-containing protein, partial [Chitinophagaceae bacterium]|nr:T9SS type A sorting domain-containing protein [Chitinophagaceae bacterium]
TPLTTTATSTTYYVSGKNGYGCEGAKKTITVTVNPSPAMPTTTTPVVYCQGAVAVALTATPATTGDTLKWYDATPTLLSTAPTPLTTTASSMIYYVSGKNSYGCEGSKASITVNINPPPAAPLVATPLNLCKDGPSGPLTATGSNLKWYTTVTGGSGVSSITPATGTLGSTDYFVSQSSAASLGSCESPRSTLTVVVNPLPAVAISSLSPYGFIFCRGLSVTLKSIAPTAIYWQWDKAGLSIPGATADNIKADTQTFWGLTVTDMYGCKNQAKVFVYKDSALKPVLTPATLVLCEENSGLMTCSPGFSTYSFKWMKDGVPVMPVTTKENLKNTIGKGLYSVIVTNNVGCIDTTNTCVVTNYPRPVKPTIINADPLLSVATIYRYYQWYKNGKFIPGANSDKYTVPGPGKYSVQITDENGCLNESDTIEILAPNNIQKQLQHANIKIYPNPTHDVVNIDAPISVNASVFDLLGKQVFSGKNVTHISLQAFADGTYVLYISDQYGNYIGTEKMIKMTQ